MKCTTDDVMKASVGLFLQTHSPILMRKRIPTEEPSMKYLKNCQNCQGHQKQGKSEIVKV
jgi:hypothetical protein